MKVLIFIPSLNEEPTMGPVVRAVKHAYPEGHVPVVDDGSTDRTAEVAKASGAEVLARPVNGGILAASRDGFQYALDKGFDVLIQVDADGQHDPNEIPQLLAPIQNGKADF